MQNKKACLSDVIESEWPCGWYMAKSIYVYGKKHTLY